MRLVLLVLLPFLGCTSDSSRADSSDPGAARVDQDGDGVTEAEGDCDDTRAEIYGSAVELCDNIDNNCNLEIDEGLAVEQWPDRDADGYGDLYATPAVYCAPLPGRVQNADDCNDFSSDWNPDAAEVGCDDLNDYNCDGYVENIDEDNDGFPPCIDCDDTDPLVNDGMVETCNGFDDDCDGEIDGPEAYGQPTWYQDLDDDGYGNPRTAITTCDAPLGFILEGTDCNDEDPGVVGGEVAPPGSVTLYCTGDVQVLDLPNCVREVVIEAYGAAGTEAYATASVPGLGGMARGTLSGLTGEELYVFVGGNNGYNGGGPGWALATTAVDGNGGGASDVRLGGMELEHRIIVAGGGGGLSGDSGWGDGGDGGGGVCGTNYCGGEGGEGYGFDGTDGGERGGTSSTGPHGGGSGGGGVESGGAGATSTGYGTAVGGTGELGLGGQGEATVAGCCETYGVAGGGGGYYGGGGVAGGCCGAGGAGGGSSWTGTLTDPAFAAGVQAGDGMVTITWY